jgi:hypothetical protein
MAAEEVSLGQAKSNFSLAVFLLRPFLQVDLI